LLASGDVNDFGKRVLFYVSSPHREMWGERTETPAKSEGLDSICEPIAD